MPWWDFLKRKDREPEPSEATAAPSTQPRRELPLAGPRHVIGRRPTDPTDPNDPAARERRRQRLERRVADLRYDLAQAETAQHEPNRWTKRIDGITAAIEQARRDAEAVLSAPPGWVPHPLPAWPVVVEAIQPQEPADVAFRVGEVAFHYSEALDWAERGHQQAAPELRRVAGEIERLMPAGIPPERRDELREHLAHGLSTLAESLRDDALEGRPSPTLTLADLASPCERCGGWRDLKGRCLACQEREWRADALRADAERLIQERNGQTDELARQRERLPLLRRQLADAEAELASAS